MIESSEKAIPVSTAPVRGSSQKDLGLSLEEVSAMLGGSTDSGHLGLDSYWTPSHVAAVHKLLPKDFSGWSIKNRLTKNPMTVLETFVIFRPLPPIRMPYLQPGLMWYSFPERVNKRFEAHEFQSPNLFDLPHLLVLT